MRGIVILSLALLGCSQVFPPRLTDVGYQQARAAAAHGMLCPRSCKPVATAPSEDINYAVLIWSPEHDEDVIKFNPRALAQISESFGGDAVLGVFAHEYGHHIDLSLNPQALADDSTLGDWGRELRADRWAGCQIAVAGAAVAGLNNFLRQDVADSQHPPGILRAQQVLRGFYACAP